MPETNAAPDRMTDERLDELERLENAATSWPWVHQWQTNTADACTEDYVWIKSRRIAMHGAEADCQFIVAARAAIPALIRELRRERQRADAVVKELTDCVRSHQVRNGEIDRVEQAPDDALGDNWSGCAHYEDAINHIVKQRDVMELRAKSAEGLAEMARAVVEAASNFVRASSEVDMLITPVGFRKLRDALDRLDATEGKKG